MFLIVLGVRIIIPLIKDKSGNCNNVNNYRGITLSSIISKLFELCLANLYGDKLNTSYLQFGFKKKLGCANAIYALRSVVDYYVKYNSTVNACLLDVSKAFDRVNYYALFIKLMKRNIPIEFLNVLINWYSKSCGIVKWLDAFSSCFALRNGVRQGGVLSPILFAVYVNDFVEKLSFNKLGCYIGDMFIGCIVYADDIILLSSSLSMLQRMLRVCESEAEYVDIKFNVKKSMIIRFGTRCMKECVSLTLQGSEISYVNEAKYLGVYILSGQKFKISLDKPLRKFCRSYNWIYSKCKGLANDSVVCFLINTYCKPFLLYGSEAVVFSKTDMNRLNHAWHSVFYKIFKLNDMDNINSVLSFMNSSSLLESLNIRRNTFSSGLAKSNNMYMKFLYDHFKVTT